MKYLSIKPSERVTELVRFFWVLESEEPYTHYSMADVCPELIFHYYGRFDEILNNGKIEKSFTSGIHGQTNSTRKFHIDRGFGIFGVYLFPHAIPFLFGIAATELTNQMPGLNELLGLEGSELEEKIMLAKTHDQRIEIIENFIEKKLLLNYKEQLPVFNSIKTIIQNKGLIKVRTVSSDHFLSERQFERRFRQFSGFNPKLFSRIVRFQSAMAQYGKKEKSLTKVALDCGYYDQSHFIQDFKEFSGHHPKLYFSGNSDATVWRD